MKESAIMRKILVVCATALSALAINAASINWTITNVYSSNDSTTKAAGYSALLFLTSNTSNVGGLALTTLADVTLHIGQNGWADAVVGMSVAKGSLNTAGSIVGAATGISSDFSSGALSGFAIIFDAKNVADARHYYLVNAGAVKDVSFTSATGSKTMAFGNQATASAIAGNWAPVPEPTSGLLLLLGMAGLALRRKQA